MLSDARNSEKSSRRREERRNVCRLGFMIKYLRQRDRSLRNATFCALKERGRKSVLASSRLSLLSKELTGEGKCEDQAKAKHRLLFYFTILVTIKRSIDVPTHKTVVSDIQPLLTLVSCL